MRYLRLIELFPINRALLYNGWKATAHHRPESGWDFANDTWELYNTTADSSEVHDLASDYPLKFQEMIDLWFDEARSPFEFSGTIDKVVMEVKA